MTERKVLRFAVKSFHPNQTASQQVSALASLAPELNAHVRGRSEEYAGVSIEAEREQSVPLDSVTAYLIVSIVAAAGSTAGGFFAKLGEDIYEYLKGRIRNGSIDPD